MDIEEALREATACLGPVTDMPRLEAEVLLSHVTGLSRTYLLAHPEHQLTSQLANYQTVVHRRASGYPLPYLTGQVEFYGLDFTLTPAVLIPRPETETLVDLALAPRPSSACPLIADAGTGSGCIGVALAMHLPGAHIYATDLSAEALEVAAANARRHGVAGRVTFLQGDLVEPLPGRVDLIVANPPYVAADEWDALSVSVRQHEPRLALDGGPDGLAVIRRLLAQAPSRLRPGGRLLMELGARQGTAVAALACAAFPNATVRIHPDLAGRDRVLEVRL